MSAIPNLTRYCGPDGQKVIERMYAELNQHQVPIDYYADERVFIIAKGVLERSAIESTVKSIKCSHWAPYFFDQQDREGNYVVRLESMINGEYCNSLEVMQERAKATLARTSHVRPCTEDDLITLLNDRLRFSQQVSRQYQWKSHIRDNQVSKLQLFRRQRKGHNSNDVNKYHSDPLQDKQRADATLKKQRKYFEESVRSKLVEPLKGRLQIVKYSSSQSGVDALARQLALMRIENSKELKVARGRVFKHRTQVPFSHINPRSGF